MTITLLQFIGLLLLGLNVLTFIVYWFDKWMARANGWRIPEFILWLLALLGGSIGALLAAELLRHKNKKLSFQLVLWLIILLQLGVGAGYYWLQRD
ncbi:MAG: DUF1294 domain-containing protein [Candidatus Kerfeldbacteria bacterium]|nr:DUF1294 domain-containing protein [Candidatus Kerfeldbacteria bacterium]